MSDDLIFEDPPTGTRAHGDLSEWLWSLRDHPNVWVKFTEDRAANTPRFIMDGKYKGTVPGEFEATGRTSGRGARMWIYARYVGGDQ